ncbi:MAG: prolyl oligopeptidase family serine peptidase [Clostridia bacterium]|nr:prolyl oligopeptidase family serine peptidase [Clostridia bacterium]
MDNNLEIYEDKIRREKACGEKENVYSKYCDFIYYKSSVNPELTLAMRILKPEKPSYLVATTHGWHMSIFDFKPLEKPQTDCLLVEVDMRGRAFSDGKQDCNGLELIDVIDAVEYVKKHYKNYLISTEIVFFEGGSGGGGNAYALAGKFPDYFAQITAMCGITDYGIWYDNDAIGEFRDELDVWIGDRKNQMSYDSRSGICLVENLSCPLLITHGAKDIRVPCYHAENYIKRAENLGKSHLIKFLKFDRAGGQDHWENMTEKDLKLMSDTCNFERENNFKPTEIPNQGELVVGGYLITKKFEIFLNDINKIAKIKYDYTTKTASVFGISENEYLLTWK